MELGKPAKLRSAEHVLNKQEIYMYARQILNGSEAVLQRTLVLDKLNTTQLVRLAGGQRLLELYNSKDPQITHAELVDIVYQNVNETGIMQTSTKPLTTQQTSEMFNEISPGLAVDVKRVQHGRMDSDFSKVKEKDMFSVQKLHRHMSQHMSPRKKPRSASEEQQALRQPEETPR